MIPKKSMSDRVEDYRPISPIKTEQKNHSQIVASRVRAPSNGLIRPHQSAHLPTRTNHISLLQIGLSLECQTNDECLVLLDFSKAFDS